MQAAGEIRVLTAYNLIDRWYRQPLKTSLKKGVDAPLFTPIVRRPSGAEAGAKRPVSEAAK